MMKINQLQEQIGKKEEDNKALASDSTYKRTIEEAPVCRQALQRSSEFSW
jgi:hypothetical protein